MMRKLISTAIAMVMVLGFVSLAAADDDQRFRPAREAIEASGVKVQTAQPGKDFRGNEALILQSDMAMDDVVKKFRALYNSGDKIGDATVVGLAHIVHNDSWNITLKENNRATTFKVSKDEKGSRLIIRQPMDAARRKR